MRRVILATTAVVALLTGCSQANRSKQASEDVSQGQAREEFEPPNISPTAAPGVAWRYSYDYQLADEAISGVQEAHAAACEAMGTAKCRITGLDYHVMDDKSVSASLEVKLAPEIARQFGKSATERVKAADGSLLRTQFNGEDVTPVTSSAGREEQSVSEQIADVEKRLAAAKSAAERTQLNGELTDLKSRLANAKGTIAGANERLASAPMTFNYYGRGGIAGFRSNPVREAARSFVGSLVTMVTVVLQALALILPWALLLALLVILARTRAGRAVRRFFSPRGPDETSA
jgi:uncharacterized lipoprotein